MNFHTNLMRLSLVCMLSFKSLALSSFESKQEQDFQQDLTTLKQMSRGFSHVAQKALNAVVSIHIKGERTEQNASPMLPHALPPSPFQDDFFRRFFGVPEQKAVPFAALGSGVLVSADGYIVTNHHVIRDANHIEVILHDDRKYPAQIIGADPDTDLAVLKIDGKEPFTFLPLGDSDKLLIGEWVIAIGTPRLPVLKSSLTVGVVSAKGRSNLDITAVEEYIQTDAAINLGNSGGPLLNVDGEIIGINNSLISSDGNYIGIGFAIPSKIVKNVTKQLMEHGHVRRGFIGIYYKPVTEEIAEAYHLEKPQGIVVTDVVEGSPAQQAGLKFGDVITAINGEEISNIKIFYREVALAQAGQKIKLSVNREGKSIVVPVIVSHRKDEGLQIESTIETFGMRLKEDTVDQKKINGFEIVSVDPGSSAYRAGIRSGMRLVGIGRKKPQTVTEAYELLKQAWKEKKVLLLLEDGDASLFVTIQN